MTLAHACVYEYASALSGHVHVSHIAWVPVQTIHMLSFDWVSLKP